MKPGREHQNHPSPIFCLKNRAQFVVFNLCTMNFWFQGSCFCYLCTQSIISISPQQKHLQKEHPASTKKRHVQMASQKQWRPDTNFKHPMNCVQFAPNELFLKGKTTISSIVYLASLIWTVNQPRWMVLKYFLPIKTWRFSPCCIVLYCIFTVWFPRFPNLCKMTSKTITHKNQNDLDSIIVIASFIFCFVLLKNTPIPPWFHILHFLSWFCLVIPSPS